MILERFPDRATFRRLAGESNVVPVGVRILADLETPVSVLARFAAGEGDCFLFESAEGGERWGRFSFLGLASRSRVSVFREEVVVRTGGSVERLPHGGDPLAVLRRILRRQIQAPIAGLPRFTGGLVGTIAYEMAHFFESRVPNLLPADQPLADFMIPDLLVIFDNVNHTLTALALAFLQPGDDPDAAYDTACRRAAALVDTLERPWAPPPSPPLPQPLVPQPTQSENDFRNQVRRVKQHIRDGDLIQAVISQSFVCPAPPDLLALYRAQRYINPSPYLYFLRLGGSVLAGSSPETMVRLDLRSACLRPIAGTRPRGASEAADRALADELLRDEKERAEHLMLVDLGRNELGRVAIPGSVQVTELMVVERYAHVMHLVSNIAAELDTPYDALDLLRASFPAGTLTGAPKVRAMELIASLEQEPRGPYGGAVGYLGFDGNMDFAICIRTAAIADGSLTIRAGAGLVADSDPERERLETVSKARSIAAALALLSPPAPDPTPAPRKGSAA